MWIFIKVVFASGALVVGSSASADSAADLSKAGWELWNQQNYSEAEQRFADAVKLNPKAADAFNGLGWSQFNQGKRDEAIAAFQDALTRCRAAEGLQQ